MIHSSAARPDSEKGTETEPLLGPLPLDVRGHPPVYQPRVDVIPQGRPRNARGRRFWHLLACTLLIFGAFGFLLFQTGRLAPRHKSERHAMASSPDQCSTKVVWEEASDVPHGYRFHLRSSVTLPVSADVLSVVAEGARFHGSLEVSQTANAGSDAIVEIDLFYHHEEDLDETTVCRLHPADNEWGLGIFTPHWRAPRNDHHLLRFHIHLRLPAVDSGSLLAVKELNTDLSNFSQDLRALADSVYFNRIALKSTNGHIEAGSVAGDGLRFQTTNAAIHGLIKTAYGLELRSTNGRINSQVVLLSNTSDALGGEYQVTAQTSNAHLELEFVDAPVDHVLTASARTSNGRADVALHETYEGSFEVHTSNAGRPIVRSRDVEDPAGRGRKRGVQVQTIRNSAARGKVWWEQENRDRGRVSVSTSNGRLQLTV